MRALSIVLVFALSGCSVLDSIVTRATSGGASAPLGYDPTKIYLGDSVVAINPRDANRYGCLSRPMLCKNFGSSMECRCSY